MEQKSRTHEYSAGIVSPYEEAPLWYNANGGKGYVEARAIDNVVIWTGGLHTSQDMGFDKGLWA